MSKSDPRKIYDETHDMVCVCRTNDQAAMVVEAVNRYRQANMIGFPKPTFEPDPVEMMLPNAGVIVKPDLTALRDAAQGDGTKDASFAVSRRR